MKYGQDAASVEMFDQFLPRVQRRHEEIKHVKRLLGARRYMRQTNAVALRPRGQLGGVRMPDPSPSRSDLFALLQLRVEKCGETVGNHITGADIHPGVLVHLSTKESAAVGSFFAQDLRALDERGI